MSQQPLGKHEAVYTLMALVISLGLVSPSEHTFRMLTAIIMSCCHDAQALDLFDAAAKMQELFDIKRAFKAQHRVQALDMPVTINRLPDTPEDFILQYPMFAEKLAKDPPCPVDTMPISKTRLFHLESTIRCRGREKKPSTVMKTTSTMMMPPPDQMQQLFHALSCFMNRPQEPLIRFNQAALQDGGTLRKLDSRDQVEVPPPLPPPLETPTKSSLLSLPPLLETPTKSKKKKKKRVLADATMIETISETPEAKLLTDPDATALAADMYEKLFDRDAKRKRQRAEAKKVAGVVPEAECGGKRTKTKKVKRKGKKGLATKGDLITKKPAKAPSPKAKATESGIPPLGCSKCRYLKYGCTDCRLRRDKQIAKMGIADPIFG